ncbi:hypothetical protein DOTSEDRAFT_180655, partial [Dothistroma septosporum NZE10]
MCLNTQCSAHGRHALMMLTAQRTYSVMDDVTVSGILRDSRTIPIVLKGLQFATQCRPRLCAHKRRML